MNGMAYEELLEQYINITRLLTEQQGIIEKQDEKILEQTNALQIQREEIRALKVKSKTDFLTGFLNREGITEVIMALKNFDYSVVLCDIDDFKLINDTYGHANGDIALQKIKPFADSIMRRGDYTSRIGGDEFVFILSGCSKEDAIAKCEQLQQLIQEESEEHLGFPMTMSFGIAHHEAGENYYDVKAKADKALYDSKLKGKAQVSVYDESKHK